MDTQVNMKLKRLVYNSSLKINFFLNQKVISKQFVDQNQVDLSIMPQIDGSDFKRPFTLSNFHFHWGYNDYSGKFCLVFRLEVYFYNESA